MSMIRTEHLVKVFGDLAVLKDVNLEVERGEVVVIIGPSGAGKSTFLRSLNGLEKMTSGKIFIEDELFYHRDYDKTISKMAPVHVKKMDKGRAEALAKELIGKVGLNVMKDLADQGMTMLCVTHEMGFAREVADKVVFMADGRILEEGKPEEIFSNPKTPEARQFLRSVL